MAKKNRYKGNLRMYFCVLALLIAALMCRKKDEASLNSERRNYAYISNSRTNLIHESEEAGNEGGLLYDELCKRIVTTTNMTLVAGEVAIWKLAQKISKIPDIQESFRLHDNFMETVIAQEVTEIDCNRRQNWLALLWHGAMTAFREAQCKRSNDYVYWDKIFRFYAKYTNEIRAVEELLVNPNARLENVHHSVRDVNNKKRYLFLIKGELKTWVRVMRDFEFPKMSKNYTPEQKADILHRLKEVEKYTVTPPHYPGGGGAK
jgi:hypothetical protein